MDTGTPAKLHAGSGGETLLGMRQLSFQGTPRAMGRAFGEACRHEIHEFYRLRVANALTQARNYGGRDVREEQLVAVAQASLPTTRAHHPAGYEELEGIAEGADLPLTKVLAMNGLTDLRDVLAWNGELETFGGCTSAVVGPDLAGGRLLCGQTWDLATDNMPYVLGVHRKPAEGPETWTLTTTGCLSLIGLNDAGVAVGTTNLRTTDARPGVTYLSMIHKALAQRTHEDAVSAIRDAERSGAHYFYVVGPGDEATALECTAHHAERIDVRRGAFVHTNHCLTGPCQAIEADTPATSSHARQARLTTLLNAGTETVGLDQLRAFFADRENGENAINRADFNGISTNGAVVMDPAAGRILAVHGLPDENQWDSLRG